MELSGRRQDNSLEKGVFGFLIVGAGRGGTSLLMGILDQHPDIEVGMEMFSMDCLMGYGMEESAATIKPQMAQKRCLAFADKCRLEASKHRNRIWGNKITTEQLYGLEDHNSANGGNFPYLHHLFNEVLEGVKVIFILRDGRACVRSKIQRTGQLMEHACQRWKYSVRVLRVLTDHHPDHHVVRYEDLVANPRDTIEQVCGFLGVDFQHEMLEGTTNSKIPAEYRSNRLLAEKLSLKGVPRLCHPLLQKELYELGYINSIQYWYGRIRFSTRIWELLLIVTALAVFCYIGF